VTCDTWCVSKTFRPKGNLVLAGVSYVLILLFAANGFYVVSKPLQTVLELVLCVCLGFITHVMWVRPKLVLQSDAIEVVNPLKTVLIPYSEVIDLETKWALAIIHQHGKTRVWVAPTSGKRRWIADTTFRWYGRGIPLSETTRHGSESMSESINSLSGQAAYLIRQQIKKLH